MLGKIQISVNRGGGEYAGHYKLDKDKISVYYADSSKTTQLRGHKSAPDILAKLILPEIVSR